MCRRQSLEMHRSTEHWFWLGLILPHTLSECTCTLALKWQMQYTEQIAKTCNGNASAVRRSLGTETPRSLSAPNPGPCACGTVTLLPKAECDAGGFQYL